MPDPILDRYTPDQIQTALERGTPDEVAILVALLRAEAEQRLTAWRCHVPDCDGRPHPGFTYPHARATQNPPAGGWAWWLVMAGRGYGKTRTGAEWSKDWLLAAPVRVALVARTFADGRDVMVEGESGLLGVLPASALKGGTRSTAWNRSMGELYLANGSLAKVYSSERPASLRGPQHHYAWGDEPAHWLDAHKGDADDSTWSNLNLGLRLGTQPQGILTSTPKRVRLFVGTKERPGITDQPDVIVTGGSTYENEQNLPPSFIASVVRRYEGTTLGEQELHARLLTDVEGALWTIDLIDRARIDAVDRTRLDVVVLAVDPNVTDPTEGTTPDDCGMVVVARADICPICGPDERGPHGFVLQDATTPLGPSHWPRHGVDVYDAAGADSVVAEVNQGGDLVVMAFRAVDPRVPVRKVTASRGKRVRAEPCLPLYEQGRVHHVGSLADLEDEMTTWVPKAGDSPNRLDALVWGLTDTMLDPPGRRLRYEP